MPSKICLWTVGLLLAGCQTAKMNTSGPQPEVAAAPTAPAPAPAPAPAAVPEPVVPAVPAVPAVPEPPAGLAELSTEQKAGFLAGDEERIYSKREHFTISNEYRHDLWFPYVRDIGGVYVGVASDQNYTLMAVARSELGYLIDLDRQVVNLHRVYMALISQSADPDAFLERFTAKSIKDTKALLGPALADLTPRDRSDALKFVEDNQKALYDYLKIVRNTRRGEQGVTWLADPTLYDYIRRMVATGRLRPINGNLLGKKAMATISASITALGEQVGILYVSNAEEYLYYTPQFATNVRALPAATNGVVLRTIHDRFEGWESNGDGDKRWNYQVQPLDDFQARLGNPKNNSRDAMLERANKEAVIERVMRGVSVFKKKDAAAAPTG
jgi:hypothetical protein